MIATDISKLAIYRRFVHDHVRNMLGYLINAGATAFGQVGFVSFPNMTNAKTTAFPFVDAHAQEDFPAFQTELGHVRDGSKAVCARRVSNQDVLF